MNPDETDDDVNGYRVWYSVDLTVEPGLPEKCLEIYCACQVRHILTKRMRKKPKHVQ